MQQALIFYIFSSDLLSEHPVGSEHIHLLQESVSNCLISPSQERLDAFYSALCSLNRVVSKYWSVGTRLCNYARGK